MSASAARATAASAPHLSGVARHGSRLGRLMRAVTTGSGIFGFVFLYAPIVILVIFSFNSSRFVTTWGGFGFRWYIKLFEDAAMMTALRNSLLVAVVSTLIATLFG